MPDWSVIITVVVGIFSAGITWGVMSSRNKSSEEKINSTVIDLKDAVKDLKTLATEFQVVKASTVRSEAEIEKLELRIMNLEIAVAKLQDRAS